jgi:hypothetical protein
MVINPFYQIVGYFGTEYSPVTVEQLDHITVSLYHAGLFVKNREQAFSVIQYLADNGVLDLKQHENETFLVKLKEH